MRTTVPAISKTVRVGRSYRRYAGGGARRSTLEDAIIKWLEAEGAGYAYEPGTFSITVPARKTFVKPDFILSNGIIVEGKGEFTSSNRKHYKAFREQYPDVDFRILFSNPAAKLGSKSPTTYAMWCDREGIPWAAMKSPPKAWLDEPPNLKSLAVIREVLGWPVE